MKKLSMLFGGTMFLVLLLLLTAFKPLPPNVASANGQGSLLNPGFNGRVQHFSFHALRDASGNVTGSWESKSPGQEIRTHGTITCLTILPDGKTAILTGIVTQKNGEGFPGSYDVGSPIWFKVVDNGEGAKSAEDEFTDYYSSGAPCNNFNVPIYTILSGNIQVKP
ncbi:MAG: hypothetical protein H7296_06930 [Bacteroidia bacterium]|nr:hypothetical protein [Bacteroidia bacterium]